ncbi:hypothetical protein [Paenibacillus sedimenti]|uniref:Uncharacterized protein n=1 Tax=Paenibacillus sedimenti TaxID=2770274 RepID=A0A926KNP2_9BACL|nr:hypothetical protein [Paenibacillus sedimenti]MBD0381075.1 hypothetical protein [Paenibacillus sedimenti]
MASILLRPDLKTAGGEVCDIMCNEEFVGTLTLVYRESDRLTGSVQLEEQSISAEDKQQVYGFLQTYIQNLVDALGIRECEVLVTYSDYDFIIATDHAMQQPLSEWESKDYSEHDDEMDYEWVRDENRFDDIDPDNHDEVDMVEERKWQLGYELVIVSEKRNRVEYHIYDRESEMVAEAILHVYGTDVIGDIEWKFDPFDEEMDHVSELIVADFDEDETDTFIINMNYNGETIDTIELTHIDLLEEEDSIWSDLQTPNRDDYTVVLARDDGDTLTYEIYQQSHGGLPIGTATVDISERQLTGFIDFRHPGDSDDRELIATLLLEELDKEKEYETFNLSMLYRNKLIDEILFETEHIH